MSSEHVRRSVKGRQSRVTGSAPSIGRVARMPGVGRPQGDRRSRMRGEGRTGSRTARWNAALTFGWSIGLAVAAVAAVVVTVVMWVKPMIHRHKSAVVAEEGIKVRVESKFPTPEEAEAVEMVRRVIEKAKDASQLESWIRADGMSWDEVGDFLVKRATRDGKVLRYEWIGVMDDNELQIESVLVYSEKDGKTLIRPAFLTPDEQGIWKMDLPSFARHASPSWEELVDGGGESGVVRVYLGEDAYFNGVFQDEREWASYGMVPPDGGDLLVGYCRVGSKQHAAMKEIVSRSRAKERRVGFATLEVARPAGAERRQFEITRVIAEGWVEGPVPFEELVKAQSGL